MMYIVMSLLVNIDLHTHKTQVCVHRCTGYSFADLHPPNSIFDFNISFVATKINFALFHDDHDYAFQIDNTIKMLKWLSVLRVYFTRSKLKYKM